MINQFHATGLLLCPVKTSENRWFLGVIKRDHQHEKV